MGGVRKRPIYKIVIADGRYPRDGKFIEKIGSYNPLLPKDKKERIKIEAERVKYWMSKGAQPTLRVSRLLGELQIMPMPKPGNNPQKAIPKKDRKKSAEETKEAPKTEAAPADPSPSRLTFSDTTWSIFHYHGLQYHPITLLCPASTTTARHTTAAH